jgi:hypothetical protein
MNRGTPRPVSRYRFYDLVMATFVTVLVCSNVIGAAKVASIGGFTFFLKRVENEDYYDRETDFTPFSIEV